MKPQELTYLLEKLYSIDKELGGSAQKEKKAKQSGEFGALKEVVYEKVFKIQKLQDERDEKMKKFGNDRDQIALGAAAKIRDEIHEIEKLLASMDETLRRQAKNPKKYPKAELEQREKQYRNMIENVENIKQREMGGQDQQIKEQNKIQTLTEMKNNVMGQFGANQNRQVKYEITKDEEQALARFEQKDKEMDYKLDKIIDINDQLQQKAIVIGDKIDHTAQQMGKLSKEVDKTNQQLMTSNRKLKELITKFRQPNKFCLDITLFLVFLGIIGVAYSMYQKGQK